MVSELLLLIIGSLEYGTLKINARWQLPKVLTHLEKLCWKATSVKHGQDGKKNSWCILLQVNRNLSLMMSRPVDYYLPAIGPKAREIYYTFTFEEEDDAMKFDNVIERFGQYFTPKKNVTYIRYKFFSCNQSEGQNIDAYVTELRKRAEHCKFAELKNSLIRDKIVIGIRDKKTQERLLRESELSLGKALQICGAAEEIKIQTDEMAGSSESTKKIDHIHSKSHRPCKGSNKHRPNSKQVERSNRSPPDRKRQCLKCLKYHDPAKCPAYSQKCHKCGHLGHYAVACRLKSGKKVRQVDADKEQSTESDDSESEFYIGTVKADIVNINCERDTNIIDHTASTDTVISGDN